MEDLARKKTVLELPCPVDLYKTRLEQLGGGGDSVHNKIHSITENRIIDSISCFHSTHRRPWYTPQRQIGEFIGVA